MIDYYEGQEVNDCLKRDAVVRPASSATPRRTLCPRCLHPTSTCFCCILPSIQQGKCTLFHNRLIIVVWQHAHELKRKAISSVPILQHFLENVEIVVQSPLDKDRAFERGQVEVLDRCLWQANGQTLLVYPGSNSKELCELCDVQQAMKQSLFLGEAKKDEEKKEGENRSEQPWYIVLIDGTWREAKKMYRQHQSFLEQQLAEKKIHQVCLMDRHPSIYGNLRKEPKHGCISTLEALVLILRQMQSTNDKTFQETEEVCRGMLMAFEKKVKMQYAFVEANTDTDSRDGGKDQLQLAEVDINSSSDEEMSTKTGCGKGFVFCQTVTSLKGEETFRPIGEPFYGTYDAAIRKSKLLNHSRTRGNRLSVLPLEAYQRQLM